MHGRLSLSLNVKRELSGDAHVCVCVRACVCACVRVSGIIRWYCVMFQWRSRCLSTSSPPQSVLLQLGAGYGAAEAALQDRRGVLPRDAGAPTHGDSQPPAHVRHTHTHTHTHTDTQTYRHRQTERERFWNSVKGDILSHRVWVCIAIIELVMSCRQSGRW